MKPNIRWIGLATLQSKAARMPNSLHNELKDAMREVVDDLQEKSVSVAPFETGDLRGSAGNSVEGSGSQVEGRVFYNLKYALRQHESMPAKRTPGTQWKYLEGPAKDNLKQYRDALGGALKEATK